MNTTELRLFTDWLAEHLGKHEDQMLTNELLDLMQQVQLTGRSGSMTLKVGITSTARASTSRNTSSRSARIVRTCSTRSSYLRSKVRWRNSPARSPGTVATVGTSSADVRGCSTAEVIALSSELVNHSRSDGTFCVPSGAVATGGGWTAAGTSRRPGDRLT